MKYQITKSFGEFPFAHRQHEHDGHCAQIHGHNWEFIVALEAEELDDNGFVFDFGKFGPLKEQLRQYFDHTTVLSAQDPAADTFRQLAEQGLMRITWLPLTASCEAVATFFHALVLDFLHRQLVADRVRIAYIEVTEDSKNAARFYL